MIKAVFLPIVLALAACQQQPSDPAPAPADTANARRDVAPSALERAGLESGQVVDNTKLSPVGFYRNRHEAGSDVLCVLPSNAQSKGKLRFGLQAVFGENASCIGSGTAHLAGERLILNFARSDCLIVAQYEGDRIALPGALDEKCNQLCIAAGSLEGVFFPRVASDLASASRATDRSGNPLCETD
jgi:hypothetical protein